MKKNMKDMRKKPIVLGLGTDNKDWVQQVAESMVNEMIKIMLGELNGRTKNPSKCS